MKADARLRGSPLVDARRETAPLLRRDRDKNLRSARRAGRVRRCKTPSAIGRSTPTSLAEKRDGLAPLAARPAFAKALMSAIGAKKFPASDIPAEIVRQLRGYQDATLVKQIADLWGVVRESPADRKKLIDEWKVKLALKQPTAPDVNLGRTVFAKTCLNCHTLYAVGGKVGPEITGANRGNIDYLLENILDPSAVIPKEYAATRIVTTDDRTIIGIIKSEVNGVLTVLTERETLTIAAGDIASRKPSELSMMPDDILKQVGEHEFRSLIAYLQTPSQVPMLATADNAKEFFNGKDLAGWDGEMDLWKVENGEIVGRPTGLKKTPSCVAIAVRLQAPQGEADPARRIAHPVPQLAAEGGEGGPQADIGRGGGGARSTRRRLRPASPRRGREVRQGRGVERLRRRGEGTAGQDLINGNLATDYTDEKLARRGVVGLQMHSGGPMEIRFKDVNWKS